jgi:malate/lactate dehydrogenase
VPPIVDGQFGLKDMYVGVPTSSAPAASSGHRHQADKDEQAMFDKSVAP